MDISSVIVSYWQGGNKLISLQPISDVEIHIIK
jgi:hypothetical protein